MLQLNAWSGQTNYLTILKGYAGALGLNQTQFDTCVDGDKYASRIQSDYQEGTQAGISSTPTFLVNGHQMPAGAQPYTVFQQQLDFYGSGGTVPTLDTPADAFNSKGKAEAKVVITEFSDFQ